ncbi:hypothetical protein Ddc_04231 [Ditylenchus destructor]|nr:hypothetical protein Ddc_04231 [Ditylenchus destructor]
MSVWRWPGCGLGLAWKTLGYEAFGIFFEKEEKAAKSRKALSKLRGNMSPCHGRIQHNGKPRTNTSDRYVAGRFRHTWWWGNFSRIWRAAKHISTALGLFACFVEEKVRLDDRIEKLDWNLPPFEEGESESGGRPKKETAGTAAIAWPCHIVRRSLYG